jgi:P4 family phage/plasmid primase-like protien
MDKKIAAPQEKGDHVSTTAEIHSTINVTSGHGQYHNKNYVGINYEGIQALVDTPQQVDKGEAQWLIPSTLRSRAFKEQEQNGEYWFLWADIDKDPPGLRAVEQAIESATEMFSCYEVYATRSATKDCQKCRVIIPLDKPLPGADWKLSQECLNDMLEHHGITPDRANERCAQLCYLPNKGAFYDSISNRDGDYFDPLSRWGHVLATKKQALREAQKLAQERIAESKAKREQRLAEGFESPIDAFNAAYEVEDILLQCGYDQRGNTFRHPNSEGGSYSASVQHGRVHSLSSADPLYTDGGGVGAHDAFSAFAVLFHNGDQNAALKDAGDHWLEIHGESWNKFRRREYMEKKAQQNVGYDMSQAVRTALSFDPLTKPGWHITPYGVETTPDLSHDQLAQELSISGFTNDARYVHSWGKWHFWTGTRWVRDEKLRHLTATRDYLRAKSNELIKWGKKKAESMQAKNEDPKKISSWVKENAKTLKQAATVNAVVTLAQSNADLVATPEQFDADLMLLGTPGGTVDLKTGELSEPQRAQWITKHCAVTPAAPGTPAPLWEGFLDRVFDHDQELIEFLQRSAGYALTGRTSEHKLLFLYGTGRNGKSVFLNTLYSIMGDYSKRAASQTFLDSHGDRHPTDLAGLVGARLVAGSELPAGKAWNESVIKDLTGGDVITARLMRQDFFDYTPQFTLFIAGNHQPSFRGIDEAIRARVVLVPFLVTIPPEERDQDLPEKLKNEWPAILRWMIDGAVQWQKSGLAVPDKVTAASTEYLDSEDNLAEFIEGYLVKDPGRSTSTIDIYRHFTQWQTFSGVRLWTKTAMTKALKERGFKPARLTGGTRAFGGVALKSPVDETFGDD